MIQLVVTSLLMAAVDGTAFGFQHVDPVDVQQLIGESSAVYGNDSIRTYVICII